MVYLRRPLILARILVFHLATAILNAGTKPPSYDFEKVDLNLQSMLMKSSFASFGCFTRFSILQIALVLPRVKRTISRQLICT